MAIGYRSSARTCGPLCRFAPFPGFLWPGSRCSSSLLISQSCSIWSSSGATDEDVSHGFFVPLVAAFIAWQRREQILALDYQPAWWGLGVMAWAALQGYVGTLGAELFLQRTSFLIALVGLLLVIGRHAAGAGARVSSAAAAVHDSDPGGDLQPDHVSAPIVREPSGRNQRWDGWASRCCATATSWSWRARSFRWWRRAAAFAACFRLTFLSLVYAYFFDQRVWMRWVLLAATIPIAILANAGRVTITGVLSEINPELAHGFFHSLEGWIIFMIALVMLGGAARFDQSFYRKRSRRRRPLFKFLKSPRGAGGHRC